MPWYGYLKLLVFIHIFIVVSTAMLGPTLVTLWWRLKGNYLISIHESVKCIRVINGETAMNSEARGKSLEKVTYTLNKKSKKKSIVTKKVKKSKKKSKNQK